MDCLVLLDCRDSVDWSVLVDQLDVAERSGLLDVLATMEDLEEWVQQVLLVLWDLQDKQDPLDFLMQAEWDREETWVLLGLVDLLQQTFS